MTSKGSLFCISCWFTCEDQCLYRGHYRSEWHCYNLERKRNKQPHITEETFNKLLQKTLLNKKLLDSEREEGRSWHCDVCSKKFKSQNSHHNHLSSHKHLTAVKEAAEMDGGKNDEMEGEKNDEMDGGKNDEMEGQKNEGGMKDDGMKEGVVKDDGMKEEVEEDEWEEMTEEDWLGDPIPPTHCLFCNKKSTSVEGNLDHMSVKHSFFLPDLEYLTQLHPFLTLLGENVGRYHMCLWCNERSRMFMQTRDVQLHMRDKQHCKVYHEGDALLEYSDFYDYRKAYPDYKEDGGDENDGGEDGGEDRVGKPEALDLDDTGLQLELPSGAKVGHRSLNLYFRQKLNPSRQLSLHSQNSTTLQKTIMQYKKMGWCGAVAVDMRRRARDIAWVERRRAKEWVGLGVSHNKLQKHFRAQILGC